MVIQGAGSTAAIQVAHPEVERGTGGRGFRLQAGAEHPDSQKGPWFFFEKSVAPWGRMAPLLCVHTHTPHQTGLCLLLS